MIGLEKGAPADLLRQKAEVDARAWLASLSTGTRVLELTVVIAPLLGLLGTVLGMIEAFRALEEAGARADPSLLAGGIWEALLTTAAGMAVAIPASVALSWIESRRARAAADLEAVLTQLFLIEAQR
jgi:biopolymer transport protein ExbB